PVEAEADERIQLGIRSTAGAARTSGTTASAEPAAPRRVTRVEERISTPGDLIPRRSRDAAIAVGVHDLSAPPNRLLLVLRLVVDLRIDPADDRPRQLVEVHRLIRIVVELQVMRGVAGVDEHELP